MDIAGCKPLFGHNVIAHTTVSKDFVGTLTPISDSTSTIALKPLPNDLASNYQFAINGVNALDVGSIVFMQDLNQPH